MGKFALDCPPPPVIANGVMRWNGYPDFEVDRVYYACNLGYVAVSGSIVLECRDDGTWSDDPPLCVPKG